MEKKLNKKFEDHITCFKNGVRDKINSMKFEEKDKINSPSKKSVFIFISNQLIKCFQIL